MQRAAIYARYSSDLQNDASIEDQIRLCSERATAEDWTIQNCYTDAGISGASLMRPGIQSLMQAAMNGEFDVLLCEALDRLSRDQEDIAGIYKRMEFAGVKIITLSEGEISTLHIGLKGTMNAMFLKDLADKTRRGLRGKVENGKSGGGLAYGYKVVKKFDASGEAIKGYREIDEDQAKVICRIFSEYANDNKSPKAIASDLNDEGIPCPSGKAWGQSTIYGNRRRGTGIINNELYIGQLVWNRQRFLKDPRTGKRVARPNPESEWIRQDVPELRIVPQELWDAVKARQKALDALTGHLGAKKRPKYLLSGLLKCGVCGGGFAKINSERYGCASARNKGESVCNNKITVKRDYLEGKVLDALQTHLMRPALVELFCREYTKHMNEMIAAQHAEVKQHKSNMAKLAKEKQNIIEAIKRGIDPDLVKDELEALKAREADLEAKLEVSGHEPKPFIHPAMASRYHAEVKALTHALKESQAGQAAEHIRTLIEKVVLSPKADEDALQIDLYGDLAGILTIATEGNTMSGNEKRPVDGTANGSAIYRPSVQMVAGAGFEPTTLVM
ncbi:MAG: recombinase family protein [Candidatus Thiodiazotropha sp. (ex Lucina aurantia)]|nr:recombinase family protein [Candidatus Thiodiazotropha taylori]MBV2097851.1 recombinase family protein [Candidatus Thiodiazotropha sp. (ex Codakia orbicularis)]MBV2103276.1 recombinase family protein [Candidatus Thiodiazotropha sp. (ex Lucina aurantia)]MBV2116361.1 recombinase family protein [Candidatus Thiodiazotropha sp. (ex Lucina aurantia)]